MTIYCADCGRIVGEHESHTCSEQIAANRLAQRSEWERRGYDDRMSGHEADKPLNDAIRRAYLKGYRRAEREIRCHVAVECAKHV